MTEKVTAVWSGEFQVNGVPIKCHELDTGDRVIEAESFERLFSGESCPGKTGYDTDGLDKLVAWIGAKTPER